VDAVFSTFKSGQPLRIDCRTRLSITQNDSGYELFMDGSHFVHVCDDQELHGFLRGIMIKQANSNAEELTMLHAAGVSHEGRAIILAAPSGGGKSTLALGLAQIGYGYLGDDTIGVNLTENSVIPFPTMVSIKKGSWPLFEEGFPDLSVKKVVRQGNKSMKSVRPPEASMVSEGSLPVAGLVFIEYSERVSPGISKLDMADALIQLDKSGAVFHPKDLATSPRHLLQWIHQTPCFRMIHKDSGSAAAMLRSAIWDNFKPKN
jgi:hypothetical protein